MCEKVAPDEPSRRAGMSEPHVHDSPETSRRTLAARPRRELAAKQAAWLYRARSRLLRRAGIARRRRVLEVGAGWGTVTDELKRRCGGTVIALDRDLGDDAHGAPRPQRPDAPPALTHRVVADARRLPLADRCCDLVFSQFTWLWVRDPGRAIAEAARVLAPGGALAAIEPDYGGLMENPPETALRAVWIGALRRAGADPLIGRQLPALFAAAGLRVETRFLDRLEPPAPERIDLLTDLPLTSEEASRVDQVRAAVRRPSGGAVAHLPCWLVLGEKPD